MKVILVLQNLQIRIIIKNKNNLPACIILNCLLVKANAEPSKDDNLYPIVAKTISKHINNNNEIKEQIKIL